MHYSVRKYQQGCSGREAVLSDFVLPRCWLRAWGAGAAVGARVQEARLRPAGGEEEPGLPEPREFPKSAWQGFLGLDMALLILCGRAAGFAAYDNEDYARAAGLLSIAQ